MSCKFCFDFIDEGTGQHVTGYVEVNQYNLALHVDGYGDHNSADDAGVIALLDSHHAKLKLFVWDNIHHEDPSHLIDLHNAKLP